MKKIIPYFIYLLLLILFFSAKDLPNIKRESNLIALSDSSIIAMGDHNYHKFYSMTKHSYASDQRSGEVIKKWGLIGGINDIGTIVAEKNSTISPYANTRKGKVKLLIQNVETEEIAFSGYIIDKSETFPIEEGTYHIFLITDEFSGKCGIAYQNAIFKLV